MSRHFTSHSSVAALFCLTPRTNHDDDDSSRPDLAVILGKPFVKRHVSSFFADISRRKPEQLGEGTIALNKVGERMGGAVVEVRRTV